MTQNRPTKFLKGLKQSAAFTLAEVLIVVGIIGIIAELTIPTLINNANKHAYAVLFKQNFSSFSQAVNLYKANNPGSEMTDLVGGSSINLLSNLTKYLKFIKICNTNSRTEGCASYVNASATNIKMLNGDPFWWDTDFDSPGAVLPNGSVYTVSMQDSSCKDKTATPQAGLCATIMIDVNGSKAPNVFGRDIFDVYLTEKGVFPKGSCGDRAVSGSVWGCEENGQDSIGESCAARVLFEGTENY